MYYHLNGELVLLELQTAVIDCGGVGYKLTISENTYYKLPQPPAKAKLYTYLSVKEDAMDLYGFYSLEELDTFKLLIGVSGIGPKAAMSILSQLTPEKLVLAIYSDDIKAISKANGIGQKTAQRVILELKDKVSRESLSSASSEPVNIPQGNKSVMADAQNALLVLGYTKSEAISALSGINTASMSLEDVITAALKKLAK